MKFSGHSEAAKALAKAKDSIQNAEYDLKGGVFWQRQIVLTMPVIIAWYLCCTLKKSIPKHIRVSGPNSRNYLSNQGFSL
jgi:hypothetical protein